MLNIRNIFLLTILYISFATTFAKNQTETSLRHYMISPPFTISSIEAFTNNPNFSVVKTTNDSFEVSNDFNPKYYTSVVLWVKNGNKKPYLYFSDNQSGPQIVQCVDCPVFNKIDSSHYQIIFAVLLKK